jgi:hypothetical protein
LIELDKFLPCHHILALAVLLEQCKPEFPQLTLVVNEALKTDKAPIILEKLFEVKII